MKRAAKIILYIFGTFLSIIIIFLIYAYFRIQISPPQVGQNPLEHASLTRINDSISTYQNNWIKLDHSGLYELSISGNPYELGTLHGLLAKDLIAYQEAAFVSEIRKKVPSESYLKFLKYFIGWFNRDMPQYIPLERQIEIYGVSQYTDDAYDFIAPKYQRILNYHGAHDIGHTLQNMNLVACTAFGAWGQKSDDGALILGRNFDFYVGDQFAEKKIVGFIKPDQGYPFMYITWGGLTGVVSGMNKAGLSITLNSAKSDIPTSSSTPVSIVARQILQYASTIEQAYAEAQKYRTFVSESFMIGSAKDGYAAIIEKTPDTTLLFKVDGHQIIGTNHFQSPYFDSDSLNVQNIRESASLYRFKRMQQLLNQYQKINYLNVAEILRDQKGMDNSDIGMCNEKAVNQLIAHHSIIFKPEQLLVWVSSAPFQLGEYVCYDLNKIFDESADYKSPIKIDSLSIAPDAFLYSDAYKQSQIYRKGVIEISQAMSDEKEVSEPYLQKFEQSNPQFFHIYKVLGDYYTSKNQNAKALETYKKALKCEFPRLVDQTDIETRINDLMKEAK